MCCGRARDDASERSGIFPTTIREPLTGQPFANNTIPATASTRSPPRSLRSCPFRTRPGATTSSGSRTWRTSPIVSWPRRPPLTDNDTVFGRYIYSDRFRYVPGWFGGDSTAVEVGLGTQLPQVAWSGGRLDQGSRLEPRERGALLVCARHQRRHAGSLRPERHGQIGFQGVPNDRRVVGGIVGIDITGHIRLGSPNFMPKFQHTNQFQWIDTLTWMKGRHQLKFGADLMMPMKNEYSTSRRRAATCASPGDVHRNAFADFLLGYVHRAQLTNIFVVNQQLGRSRFRPGRLAGERQLTVNLGLRYDYMTPAVEADNRVANFDPPTGAGGLVSARTVRWRIARWSSRQEQLRAAGWRGVQAERSDARPRRLRHLLQPVRTIGSEDQLALNPPGLLNIDVTAPGAPNTAPVFFIQRRVPGELPRSVEHLLIRLNDPRLGSQQPANDGAAVRRRVRAADRPRLRRSVDVVGSTTDHLAVLRNLNQTAAGHARRQRARCRIRTSATSSGAK